MVYFWFYKKNKIRVEQEASVLLEQTKRVCKMILVEGEFQEIIDTREEQKAMFNFLTQSRKALLIVKGKAFVGIDLAKAKIEVNKEHKTISISTIPEPEIISLETDVNYYDIQDSIFLKYSEQDLNELQAKAKIILKEKVTESHLPTLAIDQTKEMFLLLQESSKILGWKIAYQNKDLKMIEKIENTENNLGKYEK
jgi:hypothetical protein